MLRVRYQLEDGTGDTVTALPVDFVMWERHSNRRTSDLSSGVGMEDLAYLAWSAAHRPGGGRERPPFDVWLARLVDLEEADDERQEDDTVPTPPGASDGSSSS